MRQAGLENRPVLTIPAHQEACEYPTAMRVLLIFSSLAEGVFGLLLCAAPQLISRLLIGRKLAGAASTAARFAGLALLAFAVICWPRGDMHRGFRWMFAYSIIAALLLIVLGVKGVAGILLWPAVVIHAAITLSLWWSRRALNA